MDFTTITTAGGWVLAHWLDIGNVIAGFVAIYFALRARQWDKLIGLAGKLALDVAKVTELDNAAKRALVANELYAAAGVTARKLFTKEQFELAVEMGWKLIAKPQISGRESETRPGEAA